MIEQLIENLECQALDDFWYDVQFDIATEKLEHFSQEDWERLIQMLPFENEIKNQCVLECLAAVININSLYCIQKIIENCDVELLRYCVLSLNNHDSGLLSEIAKKKIITHANIICDSPNDQLNFILTDIISKITL